MRIALAQINTTVGDVAGNTELVRRSAHEAINRHADLVLFPEMCIIGYPPRDLIFKGGLVERCESTVQNLACELADDLSREALFIIPTPRHNGRDIGTGICNSLALCRGGEVIGWYDKRLLPTYDVFDEKRYFDPGSESGVVEHMGVRIGLTICEDLWIDDNITQRKRYAEDTIDDLKRAGAQLLINASASPFRAGIPAHRRRLFEHSTKRAGAPLVFTNLVGGNDDLVFDGHSGLMLPDHGTVVELPGFEEHLAVVDLDEPGRSQFALDRARSESDVHEDVRNLEHVFGALRLGVRDYLRKCGFHDVWIALSGGIDSALVAAIAVAAIGSERVRGVGLPSRYSSEHSIADAQQLADNLEIRFDLLSIEPAHEALASTVHELFEQSERPPGVAEENIQARIRGNIMMALSNKYGSLLLTTGNKSEIAVGYCTLYGDMAGGLAVISDVPKTMVYRLSRWINANYKALGYSMAPIPANTITKPPSAELRPGQKDEDSLPPYALLDEVIHRHVERSQSVQLIIEETSIDPEIVERVCRMIDRNEYKRRQMPTGLKVTGRAFGSGWRMPIAAKFD